MGDKSAQVQTGWTHSSRQSNYLCRLTGNQISVLQNAYLLVQVCEDIFVACGSDILKFRAGSSYKAVLTRAQDKWGRGSITDNEGYEVIEESPNLVAGHYRYELSSGESAVLK